MPTVHDVRALIELLCSCDVKVESAPEGNRLYWLSGQWVVSDGKTMAQFGDLSKAIAAFTKLMYTQEDA